MGIEWDLAVEKNRTLLLPLTTLDDHYLKDGYKVISIDMAWFVCGEYDVDQSASVQKRVMREKYPSCELVKKAGSTNMYHFVDKSRPLGLEIKLELIEKPKKERKVGN
jgi:hypothetical protein